MPTIPVETIETVAYHVLHAAGAPESHARIVSAHLAQANLAGHDSHGLIRVPEYVGEIRSGRLRPAEEPQIVEETPAMALVDGRWTFGQVILTFATDLAIEKARAVGTGFVGVYHEGHTGRLGAYPEQATRAGMAAMLWDGGIGSDKARMAPYGGRAKKLGANPIAVGFPRGQQDPMILDMATSESAIGKLRVARARGERLREPFVIDAEGRASDDPNDFFDGGAIMPLGGLATGHKGYGLGFMAGLFGLLASMRSDESFPDGSRRGTALFVIDVGRFGAPQQFAADVDKAVAFVKDTPLMEGFEEVLYPGEFEVKTRRERTQHGIYIEQATWDAVLGCARDFGVEEKVRL